MLLQYQFFRSSRYKIFIKIYFITYVWLNLHFYFQQQWAFTSNRLIRYISIILFRELEYRLDQDCPPKTLHVPFWDIFFKPQKEADILNLSSKELKEKIGDVIKIQLAREKALKANNDSCSIS